MRISKSGKSLSLPKNITGQGMTEYIIIVALIAVAAVSAVSLFGASVKTQFTALASELVGGDGSTIIATQTTAVTGETAAATTKAKLDNY